MRSECQFVIAALLVALLCAVPASAQRSAWLPETETRDRIHIEAPAPAAFEELGQLFGVPVQVDPEFPPQSIELDLTEADFATALRIAVRVAGAFWVVKPDGSIFFAEDTPEKREQFQPQVVQTFALPGRRNEELSEAVRLLREVLDMRRIRPHPGSNTFSVRDTPFRLAVADRLLGQFLGPPGQVWFDVVLLEIDRERALDLGLLPPDQFIVVHLGAGALAARQADDLLDVVQFLLNQGLLPPALTEQIGIDIARRQVTLPPFVLFGGGETTFAANFPDTALTVQELRRVIQSARRFSLRARNRQPADLFSGELFPVTFTTFSSIFIPEIVQELIRQGQFVPPVPALRYEELGTRLTATPYLHSGRELSLHVQVQQQTLTGEDLNGIPIFSSREVEQRVRLKEGETLLLGGIRSRERERIRSQTPFLGSLPLLGRLFRRTETRVRTTELLVLITPYIIRSPSPQRADLRPLYVGTEEDFAPAGGPAAAPAPPQPTQQPEEPEEPEQPQPPSPSPQ